MNVAPADEPEDAIDTESTEPTQETDEKKTRDAKTQDATLQRTNPNIINK